MADLSFGASSIVIGYCSAGDVSHGHLQCKWANSIHCNHCYKINNNYTNYEPIEEK